MLAYNGLAQQVLTEKINQLKQKPFSQPRKYLA